MASILLIEDEPAVRRALERILVTGGHQVEAVADAAQALPLMEQKVHDVVVTDLILPGPSGMEVLQHVQQIHPDTPVIIITGAPSIETAVEAVRTRAFEYLTKPVSSSLLLRAVTQAARMKELETDRRRLAEANRKYQENLESLVAERTRALEESQERLRQSEQQLHALAARLMQIRETERGHMAREIHDELGQLLTSLKMDLHWLWRQCQRKEPCLQRDIETITARLQDAMSLTDTTIKCVQRLASELRPSALDRLGLCAALRQELRQFGERSGLQWDLEVPEQESELPADMALCLFRITQEALTNVARHARARRVKVVLRLTATEVTLQIRDDGRGIRAEEVTHPASLGLLGIKERALFWKGTAHFQRLRGRGTCVTVRLPLAQSLPVEKVTP